MIVLEEPVVEAEAVEADKEGNAETHRDREGKTERERQQERNI